MYNSLRAVISLKIVLTLFLFWFQEDRRKILNRFGSIHFNFLNYGVSQLHLFDLAQISQKLPKELEAKLFFGTTKEISFCVSSSSQYRGVCGCAHVHLICMVNYHGRNEILTVFLIVIFIRVCLHAYKYMCVKHGKINQKYYLSLI